MKKFQDLIKKFGFEVVERCGKRETTESKKHAGKYMLLDHADTSLDRFCIVGDDPEKLAQECAEFFELDSGGIT